MSKDKLSISEQVEYMKNKKGIKFNIKSEDDARHYLEEHNYFFKLKAYAKNYEKYYSGENKGKYKDLEFEYLVELSILDMKLRALILKMCLNLEHSLRHMIVQVSTKTQGDDGYTVVRRFLSKNDEIKKDLKRAADSHFSSSLFNKYQDEFAVWNLVELISFNKLIMFIDHYFEFVRGSKKPPSFEYYYGFQTKQLRNAAAHNACLIHNIQATDKSDINKIEPTQNLKNKISKIHNPYIKKQPGYRRFISENLNIPFVHDFTCMLLMYNAFVKSEGVKKGDVGELKELFNERILRNKHYFKDQIKLKNAYLFIKNTIDFIFPRC